MKRILLAIAPLGLALWALVQAPVPQAGLAAYVPPSPLLVLQARDFHALLTDWNTSREKQAWLASDNFQVFSRSRLYQRLADAQGEFALAAGLSPDMSLVDSVAGDTAALAVYDIGELHFLYIARLPSARALETALWRARTSYETRNAAGLDYFIRTDAASRRMVAFAAVKDYLVLATREDLIAGALTLIAGAPGLSVTGERWYSESTRAAKNHGDLRLVMNLAALTRSAHFRSYWIQRNVADIRGYGAAIADLHRTATGLREERVLLRFDAPAAAAEPAPGVALLGADAAGLTRAWARPGASAALDLIQRKLLAPGPSSGPPSDFAPAVLQSANAGSESDLETRIDEPPLVVTPANEIPAPVRTLVGAAPLEAMLNVTTSRDVPGKVFVEIDTAVVLLSSTDWDPAAVAAAFAAGPLDRLSAAAHGRALIVANSADLVAKLAAAAQTPAPPAAGVTYAALFRHAAERPRYLRMMRLIDTISSPRGSEEDAGEPPFFSRNIGGLSGTLSRIESVSVTARDTGGAVFETVAYGFTK